MGLSIISLNLSMSWSYTKLACHQMVVVSLFKVSGLGFFFLLSDEVMCDYNHRMVWVGRNFKDHPIPTPCHEQGHFPLNQVAQKPHPTWGFQKVLFWSGKKPSFCGLKRMASQHWGYSDVVTMLLATGSPWHAQHKQEAVWNLGRLKQVIAYVVNKTCLFRVHYRRLHSQLL